MNKGDILSALVSEYQARIRQPGDITLKDFRQALKSQMDCGLGEKRGRKLLDAEVEAGHLIMLTVIDNRTGHDVLVWRKKDRKVRKNV